MKNQNLPNGTQILYYRVNGFETVAVTYYFHSFRFAFIYE